MLRPKTIISALALIVSLLTILGCGADNYARKAEEFYAIGEYFDAAEEYKKAYSHTPVKEKDKRGERAWKMAESYRHIGYSAKAAGGYQNAVRYKAGGPEAILRLAQMQHWMGKYNDAIKNYKLYLDSVPNSQEALNGLKGCQQAPIWKKQGSLYTIKKHPILSSRRADYSPALYGEDYDQLYFTTTRPQASGDDLSGVTGVKMADIFFSQKDDKGKWGKPEAVAGELNSAYEDGACSFSPDGKTMYFTRCTHDPSYPRYAKIMSSSRADAAWSKAQEIEIVSDTLSSFAYPAVSPDGQWLYFSSDMPGGYGGMDLWKIPLGNSDYVIPENLGPEINTFADEVFPSFRPNGQLYFSSNGHPGMGGLDLFMAELDTLGKQWQVSHLGSPMNSAGDDFGMTFEGVHNRGFFSTNRGNGRGWDQIMSFECPEIVQSIRGWVYEKDGYELPDALVYMIGNDGTNLRLSVRADGSFEQEVHPHVSYVLLGTCKGYLNHKQEISIDTSSISRQHVLQFPLVSMTTPVLIRNVFYEFDSAELTETSTTSLDSLALLLKENPSITIELSSHCDYKGADSYNQRLSQRRAESVVNHLIEQGVSPSRLIPVGYGESRPKVITRRLAEQNPFLQVGDTLTEQFILSLPNEAQQDTCNALNRRTEFRVVRTTM